MKKLLFTSLIATSCLFAGGYRIPETSLNAIALGAANVAHNKSADAAYYNPANMIFMEDENVVELDLIHIHLNSINYKTSGGVDINSKTENFYIPAIHYVSEKIGSARVGLSITAPGGLSKRWDDAPAVGKAKEFTLKTVEVNPSVAFAIGDKTAFAIGFRIVHSEGVVNAVPVANVVSQDMSGDSIDYGFNLALSHKPTPELEMAITYRSQVNLTEEGSADLEYPAIVNGNYKTALTVPLPAILNLAAAYTFPTKTTVEFVYERNFWSSYRSLNFEYEDPTAEAIFGTSKEKNWKDTNTFRLGITQELDNLTLMGGILYDQSPVPEKTLGYELPDSDSFSVSLGFRYNINKKMDIGLSGLYSFRESRKATNADLDGEFTNADVYLISTGISYKF